MKSTALGVILSLFVVARTPKTRGRPPNISISVMNICLTQIRNLTLAVVCFALSSCSFYHGEPAFLASVDSIPQTEQPPTKVVGDWVDLGHMKIGSREAEFKIYLRLRPDGTGVHRLVLKESLAGRKGESDVEVRWTYLGKNRWKIIPGDWRTKRVLTPMPPRWEFMKPRDEPFVVAAHQGKLFDMTWKGTFVSLDDINVLKQKFAQDRFDWDTDKLW